MSELQKREPGRYGPRIFTNANFVQLSRQTGTWSLKRNGDNGFEYVSESEYSLARSRASFRERNLETKNSKLKSLIQEAHRVFSNAPDGWTNTHSDWLIHDLAKIEAEHRVEEE